MELDVEAPRKADSNRFQSIYEHLFEEAFKHVRIDYSHYCFADFGAGSGKALMLASRYPFKKVIGVEFSAKLCRACEANLAKFRCPRQKTRTFEVLCIDARQYQPPPDPTVFFLFNPFRSALMHSVVDGLATSLREHPPSGLDRLLQPRLCRILRRHRDLRACCNRPAVSCLADARNVAMYLVFHSGKSHQEKAFFPLRTGDGRQTSHPAPFLSNGRSTDQLFVMPLARIDV
ncbi:MAG: class I SAM-dependent methyltransferase [Candidatus Accumulibacter sp.]|uniref:class I SAM-dependent methyltransferase n=1 Tax=Accumulibacter sp. TaxID=2053492 RepID=UPI002589C5C2|nr:class I SAM-dependent methyltransferase [Accumulibacter sp.]MCM8620688.1 class I SAM-dependent methyltransferase [Accumulibacter sp.]